MNREKNQLNRLKFKKNWPVWFWFYKSETEKTESNPNRKKTEPKPSQTEKTEPKPVWTGFCSKKPNRTETGRFEPVSVSVFFKKNSVWLCFFDKN
jgi:hypothetical protein